MTTTTKTREASPTFEELRQRMLDGDTAVTPAQIDKARREAEFAELRVEADQAALQREAQAEAERQIETLRIDAAALSSVGLGDLVSLRRTAVDAVTALRHAMQDHNTSVHRLHTVAERHDVQDVDIPAEVSVVMELDRINTEARTDAPVSEPYSRLHDAKARGEE